VKSPKDGGLHNCVSNRERGASAWEAGGISKGAWVESFTGEWSDSPPAYLKVLGPVKLKAEVLKGRTAGTRRVKTGLWLRFNRVDGAGQPHGRKGGPGERADEKL